MNGVFKRYALKENHVRVFIALAWSFLYAVFQKNKRRLYEKTIEGASKIGLSVVFTA